MTAQNMAKKILADSGYEVTTVSNGAAAVKKIAEVKPDLVILDIYMPGYTGLEVCERVRANMETSRLPVLLTVGKLEPYRPEDGARVRADGIIVKPFEATDLLGIVKKLSEKFAPVAKPAPVVEASPQIEEPEPEYEEAKPSARVEVPSEMAVAPAMELEEMPVAAAAEAGAFQWAPSTAASDAVPHGFMPADLEISPEALGPEPGTVTDSMPAYVEPEIVAENAVADFEPTIAAPSAASDIAPLPDVEFNAIPQEPEQHSAGTAPAQDPALVTEPSDITQFATSFGVEDAEEVPVGTVTGNEPFFAEPTSREDSEEILTAADVFGRPAEAIESENEEVAAEHEAPLVNAVESQEVASVEAEPEKGPLDDFEARVAAAMSAFDQPLEEAPLKVDSDMVVEQVDTFVGDSEIVNPVAAEAEAEPEPAQSGKEPEQVAPTLDVNETMVLPAEALLSLEAEMRKAMELKKAAESQAPELMPPAPEPMSSFAAEPEMPEIHQEEAAVEAEAPVAHQDEVAAEPPAPEVESEATASPVLAMAAAAAVPSFEKWNGFGEEKLTNAVQTAVERLKPQLIAEIVKALKGSE